MRRKTGGNPNQTPPLSPQPAAQEDGTKDGPPSPWAKSRAKKMLHDDIVQKRLQNMKPKQIWMSNALYKKYKLENFRTNYYSLREAIKTRVTLKAKAHDAFQHDEPIILQRRQQKFYYPGSAVEKQLRYDVQRGFTDGKSADQVKQSRQVLRNSGLSVPEVSNFLAYERTRHHRKLHEEEYAERMRFINATVGTEGDQHED